MRNEEHMLTEELDQPLIEDQRISLKGNIFAISGHALDYEAQPSVEG